MKIIRRFHIALAFCLLMAAVFPRAPLQAQVSIGPGGWITVKNGGSLMIGTDLHIKSVPGASGFLVDQNPAGNITITGDISVERYMSADVWHNVASPVSNENTDVFTGTDLVFWYDEALILNDWNFGWVWYHGATGGPLTPFRGYDVLFFTNPVTVNYQANGAETLNTGNYSLTVINTDSDPGEVPSHKGWNLAGNPYPSPVDWLAAGWNKSAINDAKYIWDGANDIYTIFLGGGSPIGINGGTQLIPSNQGFWVQSVVASGNISISNPVRVGDISGTPDFYKTEPANYPLVSLWAHGNGHSDEAVVRFIEGTTPGFDLNMDATKLYSLNPEVPQLSIKNGKHVFALNTLPEIKNDLEVDLRFRCAREGFFEIRLSERTNTGPSTAIYLRDELKQTLSRLRIDSSYRFYHDPSMPENRFTLLFNPNDDIIRNITPESWFSVFSSGNTITIIKNTLKEITGNMIIYNMLGQPVHRQSLEGDDRYTVRLNQPSGYYVVSIVTDQHILNSKVLVGKL